MRMFQGVQCVLGLFILAGCTTPPPSIEYTERRAAEVERVVAAKSYSDFLRGRYAALTNDPVRATEAYTDAASNNPNNADILERAVFSSLISGDTVNAIELSRKARPATVAVSDLPKLVLGIDEINRRRGVEKAAAYFDAPMTSQFNAMVAQSLLTWARYELGGRAEAEEVFASTASKDALISGLQNANLALVLISDGADEDALALLTDVWDSGIRLAIAAEYQAHILHQTGRTEEAIALLDDFVWNVGQNAAIEHLRDQLVAGEELSIPRPSLSEGSALAVYIPAAALAARTGNDLASVYFALSLQLNPDLDIARTLWADALDKADRRADAIAVLQTVPETSVFYATARGQLAWALRREGRNDDAIMIAKTALAAQPERNLKVQLGDLFRSLDRDAEAESIFSQIIDGDAKRGISDWRLLYARGAARETLGNWEDAEKDLVAALELAPNQPSLMNYLGYSWVDRGENMEEGFDLIQRAVELRPYAGYIVDSLGWAYFRLGQYDKAVEHLERAVELEPGEAVLNDHLGDAYWRVGRHLEATFQWSRALQLDPESQETELLHAKLENGLDSTAATVAANNALIESPVSP
ncbi:MAG: tetratricopeptide repeat protein [Pseudomonadota bacterium]